MQPLCLMVAQHHFLQAGLVYGQDPLLQVFDLGGVDVDTAYVDADLRKAGTRH